MIATKPPPRDTARAAFEHKALLIETSRIFLTFLSDLFAKLGYQPVTVSTAAAARQKLREQQFEILCTNLYFEDGNAIDFAREVRAGNPGLSLLVLTAETDNHVRRQALQAGVTEVIWKGNRRDTAARITESVRKHLRPDLSGARVLYVEDSLTQATILTRLLEGLDLEVDHFTTAEEAMRQVEAKPYDLVLTDLLLKGEASGLSLLRHLRSLPGSRGQIPVLTITGFDDRARRLELLRAGTNDYLIKPVTEEELVLRVTNLINSKLLMDKVLSQQAELHQMAVTDQLTGCYNRHGFTECLEHILGPRHRCPEPVSLMMVDLDHFKDINDRHGHDAGDRVLSAVGELLTSASRTDDLVARFGGEEFILFLPNCSRQQAMRVAERLRQGIAELKPERLQVTASIGVTSVEAGQPFDLDRIFKAADLAVYRAKRRGRDKISFRSVPKR